MFVLQVFGRPQDLTVKIVVLDSFYHYSKSSSSPNNGFWGATHWGFLRLAVEGSGFSSGFRFFFRVQSLGVVPLLPTSIRGTGVDP